MKKILFSLLGVLALVLASCAGGEEGTEEPGSYSVDASLSCYVPAMGGIEFGEPLLEGVTYIVNEDGTKELTLSLTKNSVTIYSITCYTFIDPIPSSGEEPEEGAPANGTIGYYDAEGNLITEGVSHTLSDDTALNPAGENINYVDSITFPITEKVEEYNLSFFINSNVMGMQFTIDGYKATLTVDWNTMEAV